MLIHFKKQAYITAQIRAQVGALIFDEAPTATPMEYFDYSNIFLAKYATEFLKYTGINEHTIELEESKQLPFGLIYSLKPVELEILKTYIKTNLANSFIQLFKSPTGASIFFNQKPDGSFCLYIDYQGLNNTIIKNQYSLFLIRKLLD